MSNETHTARREAFSWHGFELLLATVAFVLLGFVLWFAADVFLVIFIGVILAVLLCSLCDLVGRVSSLSHGWSLGIVLLLLGLLLLLVLGLFAARIASETENLRQGLQSAWEHVQERAGQYQWSKELLAQPMMNGMKNIKGDWMSRISGMFSATFGAVGTALLILFVGIFTAADPGLYRRGILRLIPLGYRDRGHQILDELGTALRGWVLGQLFSMAVVGVATAIGLWLLGIPFFMSLGILTGLLTFIPNFGPILSAVPAVLLGLTVGPFTALYVVLLYLGVQAVESNLVTPLVQQRNVDLPPVLNVGVQVVMGVMLGVLGLIAAAPLTACGMVLVKRLYVEDTLGDSIE